MSLRELLHVAQTNVLSGMSLELPGHPLADPLMTAAEQRLAWH